MLQSIPLTPPDATMKRVGALSVWSSSSDLDKKESDGRDPPQGIAPHAHRGIVGAHELCRRLVWVIRSFNIDRLSIESCHRWLILQPYIGSIWKSLVIWADIHRSSTRPFRSHCLIGDSSDSSETEESDLSPPSYANGEFLPCIWKKHNTSQRLADHGQINASGKRYRTSGNIRSSLTDPFVEYTLYG